MPLRGVSDVEEFARQCFAPAPGNQVGAELEFLVFDRRDPGRQVSLARTERAIPELPGGSRVTFEPGGQVELSGPAGSLTDAIGRLAADVAVVRESLLAAGLVPVGVGLDPLRPARRQLRLPRYEAMAEFLGEPYGALMMCSTASIQVNLDLGERPEVRWARANLLGPVLTAAFANSPLSGGRPCGWMSGRQAVWENLDPTRTAPVPASGDPAADWARYLLDARLMLVREGEEHYRPVRDGSTFRDWLERTDDRTPGRAGERAPQREGERTPAQAGERMPQRAGERAPQRAGERTPVQAGERTPQRADERTPVQAGERTRQRVGGRMSVQAGERALGRAGEHASMRAPTWADLAYHATTIFPPVRPRGWLEIRYLDAQNPRDWPVCVAVTHALVTDDRAADAAMCAAEPLKDLAPMAARCGLADPRFARAADACFRAAIEALPRLGASTALVGEVAAFADRYVTTGRSPAADLLDLLKEPGRRLPAWLIGEGRA